MMAESSDNPMNHLEDWDADVLKRYPRQSNDCASADKQDPGKEFRAYEDSTRDCVKEFYRVNHARQTLAFGKAIREKYLPLRTRRMGLWEAMEFLNDLVDDSDPDIELPQVAHAIQTAEAIRHDGHPEWLVLTGFIHDMGKVLCLFGEPQWAVTGDTFPVGCRFSEKIVYHSFFADNPDSENSRYQTEFGIYKPAIGLEKVLMSWGHDEYLWHVTKDFLPLEAQYIIRYHSFYAAHRENEYQHLMNETDLKMFEWVRCFNRYDLYSKSEEWPDVDRLRGYYQALTAKFFPGSFWW